MSDEDEFWTERRQLLSFFSATGVGLVGSIGSLFYGYEISGRQKDRVRESSNPERMIDEVTARESDLYEFNTYETNFRVTGGSFGGDTTALLEIDIESMETDCEDMLYTLKNNEEYVEEAAKAFDSLVEHTGGEDALNKYRLLFEGNHHIGDFEFTASHEEVNSYGSGEEFYLDNVDQLESYGGC